MRVCARRCARRDSDAPGEPYGDEALAFARSLCFQRDVDIEVETVDKNGNFLGALYLSDRCADIDSVLEKGCGPPILTITPVP